MFGSTGQGKHSELKPGLMKTYFKIGQVWVSKYRKLLLFKDENTTLFRVMTNQLLWLSGNVWCLASSQDGEDGFRVELHFFEWCSVQRMSLHHLDDGAKHICVLVFQVMLVC